MLWVTKIIISLLFIPLTCLGQSEECLSSINSKLLEILESDKDRVITDQFLLTTLKISKRLGESSKSKTLEEHIRKTMNSKNTAPLKRLKELYSEEGFLKDKEKLELIKRFEQDSKSFNYYKKNQRMTNQDVSTYLLIEKEVNGVDYNEMDLAISWYMQKIIENSPDTIEVFSKEYNLRNISTHIARNRGAISDAQGVAQDIERQYQLVAGRMNSFSENALKKIKVGIKNCSQDELCNIDTGIIDKSLAHLIRDVIPVAEELGVKVQDIARKSSIQKIETDQKTVDPNTTKTSRDLTVTNIKPKPKTAILSSPKLDKLTVAQDNTANYMLQSVIKKEITGANTELLRLTQSLPSYPWFSQKNHPDKQASYICNSTKNKVNFKIRKGNGKAGFSTILYSVVEELDPFSFLNTDAEVENALFKKAIGFADTYYHYSVTFHEGKRSVTYGVDDVICLEELLRNKCPEKKKINSNCKVLDPYEIVNEGKEDLENYSDLEDTKKFMQKR